MINLSESKSKCCGCGGCKNICPKNAITMQYDEKGFLYPRISEDCIDCGLCKKVCAYQNDSLYNTPLDVYAVKASDSIREVSSSGGAFTVISDMVLENGGVVYGVAFDDKLKALHIRAEDKTARDLCRGSKYSQSDMGEVFESIKSDLENGRQVLFTGTACQVDAIKRYIGENDNLLLVEILCYGIMSPKLFSEFIDFIENKRQKKVKAYYHRTKDYGWGNDEKAVFEDGSSEGQTVLVDIWRAIYHTGAALRENCYSCKYATKNRVSDILMADFWGIEKSNPDFVDNKGVSLVMVNTEKGRTHFEKCKDFLEIREESYENAARKNPSLSFPAKAPGSVDDFWKTYKNRGFIGVARKYGRYRPERYVMRFIKRILGI